MLINNKRALAYTVKCGKINNIEGADNIQLMEVGGWRVIVKKGEFTEGDLCVYFEIDSKLPAAEWSEFMLSKKYRVKTMKLNKFGVISQGLAMPLSILENPVDEEGIDLTDVIGVTYSVEEDNVRKADKYLKMKQRHFELFKKNKIVQWLYKRDWGKKLLFVFLGKKRDGRGWPVWVSKTDEERVQNMTWVFDLDKEWIVTEKIDGTSTTFTIKGRGKKQEFYVCSRNVCFNTPEKIEKGGYYETNVYIEMEQKYNVRAAMEDMLARNYKIDFITIQGETYGAGIQKKTYGLDDVRFAAFNMVVGYTDGRIEKLDTMMISKDLALYNIPVVPILDKCYKLPATCEELLMFAEDSSVVGKDPIREGIVLRSTDGEISMKAVSNKYLIEKKD